MASPLLLFPFFFPSPGAERFGLAQLHQLRGRIGRKSSSSSCRCFFITSPGCSDHSLDRLRILEETCDGFAIAEFDMILRGHGQMAGVEQSGHFDKMLQVRERWEEAGVCGLIRSFMEWLID